MDSWSEFYAEIDRKLDERRPQRAGVGDKDWREPVYGWARNHAPDETNLVRNFAEQTVDRREVQATKAGNKLLRAWAKGQQPLSWSDIGPKPIKVTDQLRVRLDAATPDDVEDAAQLLISRGKATFDEVMLLGEQMRELARLARRQGLATVAQIGDQPCRESDGGEEGEGPDDEDPDDPFGDDE